MTTSHFEVDRVGLRKLLARRGVEFAALELLQNSLDEKSTSIGITLSDTETRGTRQLRVVDDNPDGFADLRHAYTLFAESAKKANPEQRGRFNMGEKFVIAASTYAEVLTTTGCIIFDEKGRRRSKLTVPMGSVITVHLKMTHDDVSRTERAIRSVLVPAHVSVTFNYEQLPTRMPIHSFIETMPTEIADEEGYLRPTKRETTISLYEPIGEEKPMLYEMGIPVVPVDCAWHVNVAQKCPLNSDRDNVTPSYLKRLHALVVNAMHEKLGDHATEAWVDHAMESALVSNEAVTTVIAARYGENRVIRDPSDVEGTKLAMSKGYTIIEPGSFSRDAWETIRRSGSVLPAGQVTPSPKVIFSADGEDVTYPEEKWTAGMRRIVEFSEVFGARLLGKMVRVSILNDPRSYAACYGSGRLSFNVRRLGKAWFDQNPLHPSVTSLLIHEFGHDASGDHLSERFHDALCSLGAKFGKLALEEPQFFARWRSS